MFSIAGALSTYECNFYILETDSVMRYQSSATVVFDFKLTRPIAPLAICSSERLQSAATC